MARMIFLALALIAVSLTAAAGEIWPQAWYTMVVIGPIVLLGLWDMLQREHTILRNFPVVGHGRYLFEMVRPEMHQYFIESDISGRPFSREMRSVAYQRAKVELDTLPFGTRRNVYRVGYEWLDHSLEPTEAEDHPRVTVGSPQCDQPYEASVLNVSAMSFGSLSSAACLALNGGAKDGNFAHNTGEGGISPYHKELGGDLIWQIGTGYFGCCKEGGEFDPDKFASEAALEQVKMIELKLSQGAKPSHGGILPAAKITREISRIRGVPMGKDVISPPTHRGIKGPTGLLEFVARLRELAGGKPVGFKLCIGRRQDFMALCKAMLETGIRPDYIAVDGGEGGTGAAPMEFSNSMGAPLFDALPFVHDVLTGAGLRQDVRLFAAGGIINGFHMAQRIALGADVCCSARGMMFALGCIQALRCNNNSCPTGITTQDPGLVRGLVVTDKRTRVAKYHRHTVESLVEMISAAGCERPSELRRWMFRRRVSATQVVTLEDIYPTVEAGSLVGSSPPPRYADMWAAAKATSF